MSQTAHDLIPAIAKPGQLFDAKIGNDIISCIAAEALEPGRFVELDPADDATEIPLVRLAQGTTTSVATIVGVVIRDQQREANTWPANASQGIQAGSRCAVLRKGRIYVERDSADNAAVTRMSAFNIMHSSTSSAKRGMVTKAATATAAGSEVDAYTKMQAFRDTSTSGLALIDLYAV